MSRHPKCNSLLFRLLENPRLVRRESRKKKRVSHVFIQSSPMVLVMGSGSGAAQTMPIPSLPHPFPVPSYPIALVPDRVDTDTETETEERRNRSGWIYTWTKQS